MTQPRDIIVIGASLGGLSALCRIADDLPSDLPAAVLVVLHTSPQSPMTFATVLGRHTSLSVEYAEQGGNILPGHILFARPDFHLVVIEEGFVGFSAGPKVRFSRPAADVLFRSAAEIYGPRVIGVVLTGGDGDGTDGLRAIERAGGLGIVQEPEEAVDPSMPLSAIQGDDPDYCMPLDGIAKLLTRLVTSSIRGVGKPHHKPVTTATIARAISSGFPITSIGPS